jgi:hypothetical protein
MSWVLREGFCRERRVSHFSKRVSTCESGFEVRVVGSARDNKSGFENKTIFPPISELPRDKDP